MPYYLRWALDAFWELETERQFGMGTGPVPYTSVIKWGEWNDLTKRETKDLLVYVAEMDRAYLAAINKTTTKKKPNSNGQASNTSRPSKRYGKSRRRAAR